MLLMFSIQIIFSLTVNSCRSFGDPLSAICALIGQLAPAHGVSAAALLVCLKPQYMSTFWDL